MIKQSKPEWKNRLDHLVKLYELNRNGRDRWNFKGLYIELDRECKRMIAEGIMPENTEYSIPHETGDAFILICSSKSTRLDAVTRDGERMTLVSPEDSVRQEYKYLEAYTFGHKEFEGGMFRPGIGEKYPESFYDMFVNELKPGRMFTFDTGVNCRSYVCTEATLSTRRLKPVYAGDIRHATLNAFENQPEKDYLVSDDSIQQLYREVKTATGCTHIHSIRFDDRGQEEINKLYHTLEKHRTAILEIGNERIRVQKKLMPKEFRWFDKDGNRVSEEAVKTYITWTHSSPVQLNIEYKAKDTADEIDKFIKECHIREDYEAAITGNNYSNAVLNLTREAEANKKEFSISLSSFDGSGMAVDFLFKIDKDDKCHIVQVDKDPNGEARKLTEITPANMATYLTERYADFHMYVYNERAKDIRERYPNADKTEVGKKVIDDTAWKEAGSATFDRKSYEAKFERIAPELDELAESFVIGEDVERDQPDAAESREEGPEWGDDDE